MLPQQAESKYRNHFDVEREEQQQREAAERQRQATERTARNQEADSRVKEYWGNPNAQELMGKPGVRDDNSGLPLGGEIHPNAGMDFLAQAAANDVTFSIAGKQRLGTYIESQNKHLNASVTPASMRQAFDRLQALGAFAEGEVTYAPGSQEPEQPEPRVNVEELIAKGDGSRESDDRIKHAIAEEVVGRDFAAKWQEWSDHMVSVWGVSLTKPMHEFAWRTCLEQNLSPLANKTYDILRRALVRDHYISNANLTSEEVISSAVSSGTMSQRDFFSQQRRLQLEGKLNRPRAEGGV
jgi:hypothetical protein